VIAIVAPEPAPWVRAVAEAALGLDEVVLLAPWATGFEPVPRRGFGLLGARLRAFRRRRVPVAACRRVTSVPGWSLVELGLAAWARGRTERRMARRLLLRAATDRLAARWLPPSTTLLIAPACGAQRAFAAAAHRGVARVLVEDLPAFRQLHVDLDRAAAVHPECAFLRRYRASRLHIVRRERERALADAILVRGRYAGSLLDGDEAHKALPLPAEPACLPEPAGSTERGDADRGPRLLLAGLAAARSGIGEALAALEALPGATLLVRAGEGLEPADLLSRPGVREATPMEREELRDVDLVLAPAWCESYPPEVALAAARGVPVVGTTRAAGFVDLERAGAAVPAGDVEALVAAIDALLRRPLTRRRPASMASEAAAREGLRERLRVLLGG
jgi:hypothetical protein